MKKNFIASVAFASALASGAAVPLGGAQAFPIYSEDFNSGFQGSSLNLLPLSDRSSDKYAVTDYYTINNGVGGWSFTTGTYFALGTVPGGGTDGAVLVNENGGSALNVIGLAASTPYVLSFLVYGDNRPPGPTPSNNANTGIWGLHVNVNGSILDLTGTDHAAGTYAGAIENLLFSTDGTGAATVFFSQTTLSGSEASAIIDNVQISALVNDELTTPLPAALPLFAGGLGVIGLLARRKRKPALPA